MPNVLLIIAAVVLTTFSPVIGLFAAGPPGPGDPALVVSLPWRPSASEIAKQMGAQEISPVSVPFGVLVTLEDTDSIERLRRLGAFLVIDAQRILKACAA